MKKIILLGVFIGLVIVLYALTPARDVLSREGFAQLQSWIVAQGIWAPVIFGGLYATATIAALPGSALTIGGGLLFGAAWGTLINLLGATAGAISSFLIARYLGRGAMEKVLRGKGRLAGLDAKIATSGFYSVLVVRLVPFFPFNVLNYGLGLTKVRLRDYAIATLLGMAPGCFVYTSLGAAGRHVDLTDPHTWANIQVWGPFVLVILLALLPKVITRKRQ